VHFYCLIFIVCKFVGTNNKYQSIKMHGINIKIINFFVLCCNITIYLHK
jgi:hypothetical protein